MHVRFVGYAEEARVFILCRHGPLFDGELLIYEGSTKDPRVECLQRIMKPGEGGCDETCCSRIHRWVKTLSST